MVGASICAPLRRAGADAPLLDDGVDRIDSTNKRFYAVPSLDRRSTVVYRTATAGSKAARLWTVPGWHRAGFLADDGEHFVVGYFGGNLLNREHNKPDQVMLSFFRQGTLIRVVRLDEVIVDRAQLRRTVSHYAWGELVGFVGPRRFAVDTIEQRRLVYDVATGARVAVEPAPAYATTPGADRATPVRPRGRP
jgi:hypothetical protein